VGAVDPDTQVQRPNQANYTIVGFHVEDKVTGLEWQRAAPAGYYNWAAAKTYCEGLVLDYHSDWRLPTRIELFSLVDETRSNPSINVAAFPNTPSQNFWTSSPWAGSSSYVWYFEFLDGQASSISASGSARVRCVR
jgi:hypothetical protein